ncbi:MAG: HAD-IIA family hydrolase [bacterium]|jgi:HAD superfamily hydrolase (TIGR01457 family)|nr:HAD-IIA family hydrolase [bacterium]MDD3804700.1 HAD-IIA family hydrolase [bacterium]MDD4152552.1 HAD-IIA family hydrolase [bacterium]MDD4557714.1 HAD-IIA family hydrolase [bacterium]
MAHREIKLYIFDLDGVVYRGSEPVNGAVETIGSLQEDGNKVYFLTNNATMNRQSFVNKLGRIGIHTTADCVMTSAYATALYLARSHPGSRVMVIGEEGLRHELSGVGMKISYAPDKTDFVVAGLDKSFTYKKLTQAHRAINRGAVFIATNRDNTYPVEGETIPGGGAVVTAIEASTGKTPIVIGKPESFALTLIMEITGITPAETITIGDRVDTDIIGGNRAGVQTVLVLSGVTTADEAALLDGENRPDIIIKDLSELRNNLC